MGSVGSLTSNEQEFMDLLLVSLFGFGLQVSSLKFKVDL